MVDTISNWNCLPCRCLVKARLCIFIWLSCCKLCIPENNKILTWLLINYVSKREDILKIGLIEHNAYVRTLCNKSDTEDEYHFVLVCPVYSILRQKYIRPYYYKRPSVYKFTLLMQTKQQGVLQKLGKYVYESFRLRSTIMISWYLSLVLVFIWNCWFSYSYVCVIMGVNLQM